MAEHPMACPEWQEDLAGWLMAQLPPEREDRLLAHLASCSACSAEADSLLAVTAVSLGADPEAATGVGPSTAEPAEVPPPADLGVRIVGAVRAERRLQRRIRLGVAALVGAAAVLAVVALAARDAGPTRIDGEPVVFTVVPEGAAADAVVADVPGGSLVQLTATGLDPDVTYALWLSPPKGTWDDRVAGGTFRPDAEGEVDVRLDCALPADEYGRVWVTTPDGEIALDTE